MQRKMRIAAVFALLIWCLAGMAFGEEVTIVEEEAVEEPVAHIVLFVGRIEAGEWTIAESECAEGELLSFPVAPPLEGYAFSHWYDAAMGPGAAIGEPCVVTGPMTIAACYVLLEEEVPAPDTPSEMEEDEAAPAAEPEESPPPQVVVTEPPIVGAAIHLQLPAQFKLGDTITLGSNVSAAGETPHRLQWQVDAGGGWQDIEGATADTYSFVSNEQNAEYAYRLAVLPVSE